MNIMPLEFNRIDPDGTSYAKYKDMDKDMDKAKDVAKDKDQDVGKGKGAAKDKMSAKMSAFKKMVWGGGGDGPNIVAEDVAKDKAHMPHKGKDAAGDKGKDVAKDKGKDAAEDKGKGDFPMRGPFSCAKAAAMANIPAAKANAPGGAWKKMSEYTLADWVA